MQRFNRSRFLGLLCLGIFIYFLVFTESGSSTSDFRANTEAGLARKQQREQELPLRGHLSDEDLTRKTNEELRGILSGQSKDNIAKDVDDNPLGRESRNSRQDTLPVNDQESILSDQKTDSVGTSQDAGDISFTDRKTSQKPKSPEAVDKEKALKADAEDNDTETAGDPVKDFAREKLSEYLKNPIVIFSKSYCPHSKKAKHLLLDIYKINPKPIVVELDLLTEHIPTSPHHSSSDDSEHESHSKVTLGKALQDLLAEITSRRTVPNIVVGGGHSIGGNDLIWGMHESGLLAEEIKKYGGRKVISIDVHDSETEGAR